MVVGICAKNQMNANLIAYPLMLVFMMVPMFGNFSEGLHKLSGFLFTGVLTEMAYGFANGEPYVAKPLDIAVLVGELVISILVFWRLSKTNGCEKEEGKLGPRQWLAIGAVLFFYRKFLRIPYKRTKQLSQGLPQRSEGTAAEKKYAAKAAALCAAKLTERYFPCSLIACSR